MGNFDYKNICLKIRVRENLTDPGYVEFMRDWKFTFDEYRTYFHEVRDNVYNSFSEKIIRFFISYKDGILLPDRYGSFDPVREVFNKEDISIPIICLSNPGCSLALKKKYKYSAEIQNRYYSIIFTGKEMELEPPKRTLPEYLGTIMFWFSKQRKIDMEFLEQLLRDFCEYLNTDYGVIFDQEDSKILLDLFHPENKGSILKNNSLYD